MVYFLAEMKMNLTILSLACLALALTSCRTEDASHKDRLDAFLDAHHRHDIEAVLALLAPDYQLEFPGGFIMSKKDVETILVWDHAVNGLYTYENVQVEGDTLRCLLRERNDFFQLLGVEELQANMTYRFNEQGLIVEQIYEPVPGQQDWQEALKPALSWAREHRSEELAEIYPEDQFVYTAEMAKRWLTLLREWREATRLSRED